MRGSPQACANAGCRYAATPGSRYCGSCGDAPLGSGRAGACKTRAVSPLRSSGRGAGTQHPQQQQQQHSRHAAPPSPSGASSPSTPAAAAPLPTNDFAVACGPLGPSSAAPGGGGEGSLTEVLVGSLYADPMVPLCFNLYGMGAFVRVRMPSGEVKVFELTLAGRGGGAAAAGAPSPGGAGVRGGVGGLFGGLFSNLWEGGRGGGGGSSSSASAGGGAGGGGGGGGGGGSSSSSRRPPPPSSASAASRHSSPALPLRVEVSLNSRTRVVVARLGSVLEAQGVVWVPTLFFTHRYAPSAEEEQEAASRTGWDTRIHEVGDAVDSFCDLPRISPLLALLQAARGPLKWEVRRLAARRRGLLDEIKAVMAAYVAAAAAAAAAEEEEGEGGGGEQRRSGARSGGGGVNLLTRVSAELGKLRDDVGALTLRVSPVESEGGGEQEEQGGAGGGGRFPDISNGGPAEATAAFYREAFRNSQLCSAHYAAVEDREASEEGALARGRGFGLHLPLSLSHSAAALVSLRVECEALFAAARLAAREKQECMKSHFAATTPRSKIETLPKWVQDAVKCTGDALFAELGGISVERSDGVPLLTVQ